MKFLRIEMVCIIFSYVLYISSIFYAVLFAVLAQKYFRYNKKGVIVPHPFFWFISMGILMLIMGLRSPYNGVDDFSYLLLYEKVNTMNILQFYQDSVTEPGYYLLNKIVFWTFGDFQWLVIIISVTTIFLFFKALAYEVENISLPLAVFIFATTQYFYYFGIMRMGLAVAIIVFSYRFIIENKKKKYIFGVVLATLFHYSAAFGLILLFIKINEKRTVNKTAIWKIALTVPISFILIRLVIYPFITNDRYSVYIESEQVFGLEFISTLPFLILFIMYFNKLNNAFSNYNFYFLLFVVKFFIEIFSPIIGIGRLMWYANLSICILLPAAVYYQKNKLIKVTIFILTILYCLIYCYFSYFGDSFRSDFMLPYNFFNEDR